MLPRVKKIELGKVHINDDVITDNVFLHPNGFELVEKMPRISKKDFEQMVLHEPEIAVFGIGFKGKVKIDQNVLDAAKKQKIDVHIMHTPDALKKFQEFARKGRKVVAHIHVSE